MKFVSEIGILFVIICYVPVSHAITNLTLSSDFKSERLALKWSIPSAEPLDILKYIIKVQPNDADYPCMFWSVRCVDCGNNTYNASSAVKDCSEIIAKSTFRRNDTTITTGVSDEKIEPITEYNVTVLSLNDSGWRLKESRIYRTAEFISEEVTNLFLSSEFPMTPLKITWSPPKKPEGLIVQYVIILQNVEPKCLTWWLITCSDCGTENFNNNASVPVSPGCSKKDDNTTFLTKDTTFTTFAPSEKIQPYANYKIIVSAKNGFGWGFEKSIQIATSQYKSDAVKNLTMSSQFPDRSLVVNWLVPPDPRGVIVEYAIIVRAHGNGRPCVLMWLVKCSDCATQNSDSSDLNCTNIGSNATFVSNYTSFSTMTSDKNILAYTEYNVTVIPRNGYGFGMENSGLIRTAQNRSDAVTNLTLSSQFPDRSLVVNWVLPSQPKGVIAEYIITVRHEDNTSQCVLMWSIKCSDCEVLAPGINEANCTKLNSTEIFLRNESIFSTVMSHTSITPFTEYKISVIPRNDFGMGLEKTTSFKTSQYRSDAVNNLTLSSQFPDRSLVVSWSIPTDSRGVNVEYAIIVKGRDNTKPCILTWSIECSDCGIRDSGIHFLNCTNFSSNTTYLTNNTLFTTSTNHMNILPYTEYNVSVIPRNAFGWGIERSTIFRTSQFRSDSVRNLTLSSVFPYSPLLIQWSVPLQPNGIIFRYIIEIGKNGKDKNCIFTLTMDCSDCAMENRTATDNNVPMNCSRNGSTVFFLGNDTAFTTVISDALILPYSEYTATVIPVNGFGRGSELRKMIRTSQFRSDQVNNLTVASHYPRDNLIVRWQVPTDPRGQITSYVVMVYKDSDPGCQLSVNLQCSDCKTSTMSEWKNTMCPDSSDGGRFSQHNQSLFLNITNRVIQPESNFTIYVIPINGFGVGINSSISIRTISYQPLNVSSLAYVVTNTSITLLWTAPADDIFNVTYEINIFHGTTTVEHLTAVETNITFPIKQFCTLHNICVWTSTPFGNGTVSCINLVTGLSTVSIDNIITASVKKMVKLIWDVKGQSACDVQFTISCNETEYTTSYKEYTIYDLEYYTTYNITVTPTSSMNGSVDKLVGIGKTTTVITDIGEPGAVREFACVNVTFNEFRCSWKPPIVINGPSVRYRMQCSSDRIILDLVTDQLQVTVTNDVVPDVNYTCTIKASTTAGNGPEYSTSINIIASHIPDIINTGDITKVMSASSQEPTISQIDITLPFSHFTDRLGRINKFSVVVVVRNKGVLDGVIDNSYSMCDKGSRCAYEIRLPHPSSGSRKKRGADDSKWQNKNFVIGNGDNCAPANNPNCNGELSSNTEYIIGFRAYTSTGFVTVGNIIKKTRFNAMPIYVSVPIVIIVMALLIVGVVFYRRYYGSRVQKRSSGPSDDVIYANMSPEIEIFSGYYRYVMKESCVRACGQFSDINKKWKALENEKKLNYLSGNEMKNRYKNIKPYEHNVVRFNDSEDYINASCICPKHCITDTTAQCDCMNYYIAAQGPIGNGVENKLCTVGDFWRMVHEHNSSIIINLTKCVEAYKVKCAQYWPDLVNEIVCHTSGDHKISVTLSMMLTNEAFDERVLSVTMDGEEKTVTQLHFTAWPDHDCPDIKLFLEYYNRFKAIRKEHESVVVHCSAGVGRTGTFILIDMELRKIVSQFDRIRIYDTLLNLRQSRCLMVQTEKQYLFVHAVIYEYLKQNHLLPDKKKSSDRRSAECTYLYSNPAFE